MERQASLTRKTNETEIQVELNLDGEGNSRIDTGVGFFNHMLTHVAKYAFCDLTVKATGDLEIDCHHTIEDVGLVLGSVLHQALGDKSGIKRQGSAVLTMDDTLVIVAIDLSGRPYLNFELDFTVERLGDMDTEMVEEFFKSMVANLKMNCHIKLLAGKNNHHMAEAVFKAFGKALDEAKTMDPRIKGVHSTKGVLD